MIVEIVGFIASLVAILLLSKRSLWMAIFVGSIIIIITASIYAEVPSATIATLSIDNVLLAIALAEIPVLGKVLEEGLVRIFRNVGKKRAGILGPATLGLLPIPGGAILSCPILERTLGDVKSPEELVAVNVWFRHFIFFVYPLSSALIISIALVGLDLLVAISYLSVPFVLSLVVGYFYYIRGIKGEGENDKRNDSPSLRPILILLSAPAIQLILKAMGVPIGASTFIAVTIALLLGMVYTKNTDLLGIAKKVKAWNFSLILISILFYSEVFKRSPIPAIIRSFEIPLLVLLTLIPFIVGFATGRVQLTIALVVPVIFQIIPYVTPSMFMMLYTTALMGYLLSPAHPCLVLSAEYFRADVGGAIKNMLVPAVVVSISTVLFGLLVSG